MTEFDIFTQWLVFLVVAFILFLRGQVTVYHPVSYYLLFHCIVFCVRPTLVWALGFDYVFRAMMFNPEPEVLRATLLLSSFALVCFSISFSAICATRSIADWGASPGVTDGMKRSFRMMAVIVIPLGLYSIFTADKQGTSIGGVYIMTGTSGYTNDLQQVFVSFVALFAYVTRWRWYSTFPLLLFIVYRAGEGHSRWMMVYPIMFIVLLSLWERRRLVPSIWALLPIPLIVFLFTNLTHDRWFIRNWIEGAEFSAPLLENAGLSGNRRFDTMDFANFDFLAFVIHAVPEKTHGFNYGAQHLQLFTEPIPRKLWKGKPIGAPVVLADWTRFGNTNGITISVVGDGWISYGWLGVVINMVFYGTGLALFYNWFALHQPHFFRSALFLLSNAILVQVFRDGSFVSMAKFLVFTTFPIFLWWVFHKVLFPDDIEIKPE